MRPGSVRGILATTGFLLLAWFGCKGGVHDLGTAESGLQQVQAGSQLAYGLASLAAIALLWVQSARLRLGLAVHAILFSIAGALAPSAWAGAPWTTGVWAALLTLAVAGALSWLSLTARAPGAPR